MTTPATMYRPRPQNQIQDYTGRPHPVLPFGEQTKSYFKTKLT